MDPAVWRRSACLSGGQEALKLGFFESSGLDYGMARRSNSQRECRCDSLTGVHFNQQRSQMCWRCGLRIPSGEGSSICPLTRRNLPITSWRGISFIPHRVQMVTEWKPLFPAACIVIKLKPSRCENCIYCHTACRIFWHPARTQRYVSHSIMQQATNCVYYHNWAFSWRAL